MYHTNPTTKTPTANGYNEGYKFKEVDSLTMNTLSYSGGFDDIGPSKTDRLFIVKKGTGFATIMGKTHRLDEGAVLEVPASQSVELSSAQIIFYVISTK